MAIEAHANFASSSIAKDLVLTKQPQFLGSCCSQVLAVSRKPEWYLPLLNSLASGCFRGFSEKKHLNACGSAREFLWSGMLCRIGKSLKKHGK